MRVPVRISNAEHRELSVAVPDALIDNGATWTTIPRAMAQGLQPPSQGPMRGRFAGDVVTLEQSFEGKHRVAPALISDAIDIVLIGVVLQESLAPAVDPSTGRLIGSEIRLV